MFHAMTMFASKVRAPEMVPSFLHCAPMLCRDHAIVDGALQAVHRLALIEQIEDLQAKRGVAEIVAEIEGTVQPPQPVAGIVDGGAGGGRPETVERRVGRIPAVFDRGAETKQSFPAPSTCQFGSAGCKRSAVGIRGLLATCAADFRPDLECLGPGSSMLGGSDMIAAEVKQVIDLIVG